MASLAACLRATNLISSEVRTVRMLGRYVRAVQDIGYILCKIVFDDGID